MVRHDLPIVTIVTNNRSWAAPHFQELAVGTNRVTRARLGDPGCHDVAAGFGCHSVHVTRIEGLGPAIRAALASGRPSCITVEVDVAPIPPEVHLLMRR